ncbi:MAG: hypothetical protein Q9191_005345 [Dirinaria sp. TL-2023a]
MADSDKHAHELQPPRRLITSHNQSGQGVFVSEDSGDHQRVIMGGKSSARVIYSTKSLPIDMNDEADLDFARNNEPGIHIPSGTVTRIIDWGSGIEGPLHRTMALTYAIVLFGAFELILDSGQSRTVHPGDVTVDRGTMHKWRNVNPTGGTSRMLFVILDAEQLYVDSKAIDEALGHVAPELDK